MIINRFKPINIDHDTHERLLVVLRKIPMQHKLTHGFTAVW
ncbi:Uncharacterised protein [Vibrio cholerae]|nr:Uncharacterised protein [Vibrio cholerae]